MRIVLAIGSLEIGGSERQLVRLARELKARGHDVHVLLLSARGPLVPDLDSAEIPVHEIGLKRVAFRCPHLALLVLARALRIPFLLRRLRPDVVHAFLYWAYALVIPAAALARVPWRVTARRNLATESRGSLGRLLVERIVDKTSHMATANSSAVARAVVELGVAPSKVAVVRNGVDLPRDVARVETQPPRGVVIANLIAYKGHRDLIAALALLDDPPTIECYGDGPERQFLEAGIATAGLADRVLLRGCVPDAAAAAYPQAQFAVLASHEEGLPNALLEAMAYGLPVIATAVGGVPELVLDGETGLIVPARDPHALALGIRRLVEDADLRIRFGRAGRQRARDFGWDRVVQVHERLYARR